MPAPATLATDLYLTEVFSSIQGEGILLGRRQLFVRLAGCNLACAYCDTNYVANPTWRAEIELNSQPGAEYPNPVTAATLIDLVRNWQTHFPLHHSLALTGGEPLLQAPVLAHWLPFASVILPVYLETNGTLPDALKQILPWVTWVSMDVKLAGTTGAETPWEAHAAFLAIGRSKICQVKLVIDMQTTEDEMVAVARFIHRHGRNIPLVLQPRTAAGRPTVTGVHLLSLQAISAREHPETLVIPQLHPLLAIR